MKKLGTVFAAGARTPLGPDLLSTALLFRAGLPALTAAPLSAGGNEPVTMAFDPTLDPMLVGEERAAVLAKGALQDLVAAAGHERVRALKLKAEGKPARIGPKDFPSVPYPEPLQVPTPWQGGDGRATNDVVRDKSKRAKNV